LVVIYLKKALLNDNNRVYDVSALVTLFVLKENRCLFGSYYEGCVQTTTLYVLGTVKWSKYLWYGILLYLWYGILLYLWYGILLYLWYGILLN
jgi:hypothetical protein